MNLIILKLKIHQSDSRYMVDTNSFFYDMRLYIIVNIANVLI